MYKIISDKKNAQFLKMHINIHLHSITAYLTQRFLLTRNYYLSVFIFF